MEDPNSVQLKRLRKRKDFLAARNGARDHARCFSVQAHKRLNDSTGTIDRNSARIGFTVTKKTGNAVVRNRIRRRLREVVRLNATSCVQAGYDYVLIARHAALHSSFPSLVNDFHKSIGRVSRKTSFRAKSVKQQSG